ncbi:MAG: diacylglycerol/lipid kinase family protein [Bdellovibrionales bacterium]
MRVSVVMNPRAGNINLKLVESKIREALFRCELKFYFSDSFERLNAFVKEEIEKQTSAFLICGGDGTVNATLQCMIQNQMDQQPLPPICLISSGTANDLAQEINITRRVDRAARLLFEGVEKKIDLIEVEANGQKKYMLTNGGVGVPALAASKANQLRKFLSQVSEDPEIPELGRQAGRWAQSLVRTTGPMVYSLSLLQTILDWNFDDWKIEVELPNQKSFTTQAPFVLVNNQPTLGKNFLTAPYTAHNDGLVNLLVIESNNRISQIERSLRVFMGNLREQPGVKSLETPEFRIRAKGAQKKITFFGDGEVLFGNVDEVKVKCLKRSIGVMVNS